MGDEKAGHDKPFDPRDPWREMRDTYLEGWSKTMVETVNTDAYAKATGAMLDTYLSASSPFRETEMTPTNMCRASLPLLWRTHRCSQFRPLFWTSPRGKCPASHAKGPLDRTACRDPLFRPPF